MNNWVGFPAGSKTPQHTALHVVLERNAKSLYKSAFEAVFIDDSFGSTRYLKNLS